MKKELANERGGRTAKEVKRKNAGRRFYGLVREAKTRECTSPQQRDGRNKYESGQRGTNTAKLGSALAVLAVIAMIVMTMNAHVDREHRSERKHGKPDHGVAGRQSQTATQRA